MKNAELLDTLFVNHRQLMVPPDATGEPLSRLHADLVEYDGFVAGIVETILQGRPRAASNLYYDEELQCRLEAVLADDGDQALLAGSYRNYLLSIKNLVDAAEIYASSPTAA